MLKLHVQKLGDTKVFCLRGGIGVTETSVLRTAVLSHLDVRSIVLDFGKVNRIDAAGLGLLLELREQTEAKAISFKLMNVTRLIQHVLDMTCLSSVFHITPEGEVISTITRDRTGGTFKLIPCAQ